MRPCASPECPALRVITSSLAVATSSFFHSKLRNKCSSHIRQAHTHLLRPPLVLTFVYIFKGFHDLCLESFYICLYVVCSPPLCASSRLLPRLYLAGQAIDGRVYPHEPGLAHGFSLLMGIFPATVGCWGGGTVRGPS